MNLATEKDCRDRIEKDKILPQVIQFEYLAKILKHFEEKHEHVEVIISDGWVLMEIGDVYFTFLQTYSAI